MSSATIMKHMPLYMYKSRIQVWTLWSAKSKAWVWDSLCISAGNEGIQGHWFVTGYKMVLQITIYGVGCPLLNIFTRLPYMSDSLCDLSTTHLIELNLVESGLSISLTASISACLHLSLSVVYPYSSAKTRMSNSSTYLPLDRSNLAISKVHTLAELKRRSNKKLPTCFAIYLSIYLPLSLCNRSTYLQSTYPLTIFCKMSIRFFNTSVWRTLTYLFTFRPTYLYEYLVSSSTCLWIYLCICSSRSLICLPSGLFTCPIHVYIHLSIYLCICP